MDKDQNSSKAEKLRMILKIKNQYYAVVKKVIDTKWRGNQISDTFSQKFNSNNSKICISQ